jgi:hypothetical protein
MKNFLILSLLFLVGCKSNKLILDTNTQEDSTSKSDSTSFNNFNLDYSYFDNYSIEVDKVEFIPHIISSPNKADTVILAPVTTSTTIKRNKSEKQQVNDTTAIKISEFTNESYYDTVKKERDQEAYNVIETVLSVVFGDVFKVGFFLILVVLLIIILKPKKKKNDISENKNK